MFSVVRRSLNVVREVVAGWFHKGTGHRPAPAEVFAVSPDNLLNDSENSVVELQNHELNKQLMMLNQFDDDEKNALVKIINSMLTKKRMKDLLDGKIKLAL